MKRICLECGGLFEVSKTSPTSPAKFCSNTCGYLYRKRTGISSKKNLTNHKCKVCGKSYFKEEYNFKTSYCSKDCARVASSIKFSGKTNKRFYKCLFCGKEFSSYSIRRKYCSRECWYRLLEKRGIEKCK